MTVSLLFLIWGAAWAAAYYIPPSILAMRIGGSQHAALVTNVFDMGGYVFGAFFSYYATKSAGRGEWSSVMLSLILCNAVGLGAMALAMSPDEMWIRQYALNFIENSRVARGAKLLHY